MTNEVFPLTGPVDTVLMRGLLMAAKKKLKFFMNLRAKQTRDWFMYGTKPGDLPKAKGDTVKWRRIDDIAVGGRSG